MTTYNHAFDLCFEVRGSTDCDGDDITGAMMRAAIQRRLDSLSDDELIEAAGMPFDTYQED